MPKKIDDPVGFLTALRQAYWRGQSYAEMYDELFKILIAKSHAERTGATFSPEAAPGLWLEASAAAGLATAPIPSYSDGRLEAAVALVAGYDIVSNRELWHVMHRAWLSHGVKRDNGQYYTPDFIKRFMVAIYPPRPGDTVCDPCGGSAGFITEAADAMPVPDPRLFHYYDIDGGQTASSARMILATHVHRSGQGLSGVRMTIADSLAATWPCAMDRIYTNVPFGIRVSRRRRSADGPLLDEFRCGLGKQSELSQVLFMEKCLSCLSPGGKFITIVDRGVVTNDSLRADRARLLGPYSGPAGERRYLELVVELPARAFEYVAGTTFQTYVLAFSASPVTRTSFASVPDYDPCADGDGAWSGFEAVLTGRAAGTLPWVPHADVEGGDWHYGAHAFSSYAGQRLGDVADLVVEDWPGGNQRNPTVDRRYRILVDSHLEPKSKARTLRAGCLFMSRLISPSSQPCCGVVTPAYDGAGSTGENYVIRPRRPADVVWLWYVINFDRLARSYLVANSRGQGRGRVLPADLLRMPVPRMPQAAAGTVSALLKRLIGKASSDDELSAAVARMCH